MLKTMKRTASNCNIRFTKTTQITERRLSMASSKGISFEGQDFSIGVDVHKKNWLVAIRNNGLLLKRFSIKAQQSSLP